MKVELLKCFLTGAAGLLVVAAVIAATFIFWPYSGYVWGALFIGGACIGLGSDMRSSAPGTGPR